MSISRVKTLSSAGEIAAKLSLPMAPLEEHGHVFRGDLLTAFIMHYDKKTGRSLTDNTKMFPYGLQIIPREYGGME